MIKPVNPCYIKLANIWIILNSGGGPTPDKPEVLLETLPMSLTCTRKSRPKIASQSRSR